MKVSMQKKLVFLFLVLLAPCVRAEFRLSPVFSDNMVLQRNEPVCIFGEGTSGAVVSVEFAGQRQAVPVSESGRWSVRLEPLETASVPAVMTVVASSSAGRQEKKIQNVLVGDVWFCSGQSNMAVPVSQSLDAEKEIAAAQHPELRFLKVRQDVALAAREDVIVERAWSVCTPESVGDFSAVAYYFGREIQRESGVPIGVIQSAWGGTPIEAWIPAAAMESDSECAAVLKPWEDMRQKIEDYDANFGHYVEERKKELQELNRVLWQWTLRKRAAKEKGEAFSEPAPKARTPPLPGHQNTPEGLFNAMVSPVTPLAIRGVIWYQGESNANQVEAARLYGKQLPLLIKSWRAAWKRPDLPFYLVQIANYDAVQTSPKENGGWPLLRAMQLQTWKNTPHTGMASTIDLGEADNIHPKNKQEVGRRLARYALKNEYGKDETVSGPIFRSARRSGGKVVLDFDYAEGGLAAREGSPMGFALGGADGKWHWAQAEIAGGIVYLQSEHVSSPVAVAYGWASNPIGNLYNPSSGLPVVPFCEEIP